MSDSTLSAGARLGRELSHGMETPSIQRIGRCSGGCLARYVRSPASRFQPPLALAAPPLELAFRLGLLATTLAERCSALATLPLEFPRADPSNAVACGGMWHATSSEPRQKALMLAARRARRMPFPQHASRPPGRPEHPIPPHVPQLLSQQ